MLLWKLIASFLIWFIALSLVGQSVYYNFQSIEPHIIPGLNTKKIVQDPKGNLYFLYRDRVIKHNGIEFKNLSQNVDSIPWHHNVDITSFGKNGALLLCRNNRMFYVSEYVKKELFLDTDKGARKYSSIVNINQKVIGLFYDKGVDLFKVDGLELRSKSQIPINNPRQLIAVDQRYYCTSNKGVFQVNIDGVVKTLTNTNGRLFIDNSNNLKLLDHENQLWTIEDSNLKKDEWQPLRDIPFGIFICYTQAGDIWATRLGKGTYFVPRGGSAVKINESNSSFTSPPFMRPPFCDRFGTVWIPGEKLYYRFKEQGFQSLKFHKGDKIVNSIFEDKTRILYSLQEDGLIVYDKSQMSSHHYTEVNSDLKSNSRINITGLKNGKYALNYFGGVQIFDGHTFGKPVKFNGTSRDFIELNQGYLTADFNSIYFLDQSFSILKKYKTKPPKSKGNRIVNNFIKIDEDKAFAIVNKGQIYVLKYSDLSCHLLEDNSDLSQLSDKEINVIDVLVDHVEDHLYIATSAGLFLYDMIDWSLVDSLKIPAMITSIEYYKKSIWASTQNGIYQINVREKNWLKYNVGHNLVNKTFDIRSSFVYKDSILSFGGYKGVDMIKNTLTSKIDNPSIDILAVRSFPNSRTLEPDENNVFQIGSNTDRLEIEVTGIHSAFGEEITLEYRTDQSSDWQVLPNGLVSLINPNIGNLHFDFRAGISNKYFSDIESIDLYLKPLWFQRKWVQLFGFLCCMIGIGVIVYWRQKNRFERWMIEKKLQQEVLTYKLQSINSQMNPHFVFNVMSGIQQLIYANENKLAMKYLNTFSKLLRHVVNYGSKNFVPIGDELTFIDHYLSLESMRFEDKFKYNIQKKIPNTRTVLVPTFLIQPLIENAIKHGLKNKVNGGEINISIVENHEKLIIEVVDNGLGYTRIKTEASGSSSTHGLELIDNKLNHITSSYGASYLYINQVKNNQGTKATLILPIILNEKT